MDDLLAHSGMPATETGNPMPPVLPVCARMPAVDGRAEAVKVEASKVLADDDAKEALANLVEASGRAPKPLDRSLSFAEAPVSDKDFMGGNRPGHSCIPAPEVIAKLKSPVFGEVKAREVPLYRSEHLQNNNGARVVRYWDRDVAYADLIEFVRDAKPDLQQWPLGDAFERCYRAHQAVAPQSRGVLGIPRFYYLHHLEVTKECRKQGIGTKLLRFILTELRTNDNPWLWLSANSMSFNDDALFRFYERLGFRRLAPAVAMMYWDHNYYRRVLVDPKVPASEVPYVPQ